MKAWLVAAMVAAPAVLPAQEHTPRTVVDRIVAIVGSRALLSSQIEERVVMMAAQGQTLPTDSAARAELYAKTLEDMIDEELMVQQAERDTSVNVSEQEVQAQVEQTVNNVRGGFSSEADFLREIQRAGFASAEEWRRYLAENQRRSVLGQRLIEQLKSAGKLRPIPPTEQQIKDVWEENKGTMGTRPAAASFRQLVITSKADSGARERAYKLADSLATALRAGADFATLAARFSDDTLTRAAGGELGWFRRGQMVPAFEAVAFSQRPGEISRPIETSYGFHVIRVDRAQPGEVLAHHILIAPAISRAQIDAAHRLADSLHALLVKGAAFDSLARLFHDPDEPKIAESVPVDSMPPEYRTVLKADTTTGLKPVIALGANTAKPKFVLLEVTTRFAEGPVTFEEIKVRIRQRLGDDLALRHYIAQLRKQAHIDVRL
jgi:peptidyl-prolyl cis-trans isomerase SurA